MLGDSAFHDVGIAFEALPFDEQLILLDVLLKKAGAKQTKVRADALESSKKAFQKLRGPSTLSEALPDDLAAEIRDVRRLCHNSAASAQYDGLETSFEDSNGNEPLSHIVHDLFPTIESHLSTIIALSSVCLLKPTFPPKTATSIKGSGPNATPGSLNSIVSSSIFLANAIGALVARDNDRLLSTLTASESLERYASTSEKLANATSEVVDAVQAVRRWDAGESTADLGWEEATILYERILVTCRGFSVAFGEHVDLSFKMLTAAERTISSDEVMAAVSRSRTEGPVETPEAKPPLDETKSETARSSSGVKLEELLDAYRYSNGSSIGRRSALGLPSLETRALSIGSAGRLSGDMARIPEEQAVTNHAERPPKISSSRSLSMGELNRPTLSGPLTRHILHKPGSQLLRVVPTKENEAWRIKLFQSDDSSAPKNVTEGTVRARGDRWSQMVQEMSRAPSSPSPKRTPPMSPHDSLPSLPLSGGDALAESMISSVSDRVSAGADLGNAASDEDDADSGNESENENRSMGSGRYSHATFESLNTINRRGMLRIPTYDMAGRRIGLLDQQGKFSSEVEPGISDEDFASGSISVKGNLLHLNEDGADVLVMEMASGRLQVIAGTLEKLVLRMADENVQDMSFVDTVLQFHTFFITSLELLDNLIARFNVLPPENGVDEDMEYYRKWKRPIQLKVLTVLSRWLRIQFDVFEASAELRERLDAFLTDAYSYGFRAEVDRIRRAASSQASSMLMKALRSPFELEQSSAGISAKRRKFAVPRLPFFPPSASSELPSFLQYDSRDMARYLTIADQNAFASITIPNYLGKLSKSGMDAKLGSRVDMFAARADRIRMWVALEICGIKTLKLRRKAVEKFIVIAKYCRELNNFHTSLFIVSGLLSAPVQRLKKTWDGIGSRDMATLRTLEKLLDPTGNMKHLRKSLSVARNGPSIPFFPLVMKDVTFLNDGNPPVRDSSLINFEKYRGLGAVLDRYLSSATNLSYEFAPVFAPLFRGLPVAVVPSATYPSQTVSGSDGLGGLSALEDIRGVIEGRLLAVAVVDGAMDRAWEWTAMVDGENIGQ